MGPLHQLASGLAVFCAVAVNAQTTSTSSSCSSTLTPSYPSPSVAAGYTARIVANRLTRPRDLLFDTEGNLLVVQAGRGITSLTFKDDGGACLSVAQSRDVVLDSSLNHGIELSSDGSILYASSAETLYSWAYDPATSSNTSAPRELVTGMTTSDHTTRTLLLSRKVDGMMLINRGSTSNIDPEAEDITSGHSQIKAFNVNNVTSPYDFNTDGMLIGWGLRNEVGIDEEPLTGGIYGVENSVDDMERDGQDIHQNNPGEELNFFGYLNGTEYAGQGQNYGYPLCFAAWNVSAIPNNSGLQVGSQFAIGGQSATLNDTLCASNYVAPRLTFQAHMAPLDILFNENGTAAWISFHGSWNRASPIGYKLSMVEFANGSPVHPANSTTAAIDIVTNQDLSQCPRNCFRPVGLAWDREGRLFMSSDSTGEIYVVTRVDGNATAAATPSTNPSGGASPSSTSGGAAATTSQSGVSRSWGQSLSALLVALAVFCFSV